MNRLFLIFLTLIPILNFGQQSLQKLLKTHNDSSIPYLSVQELAMPKTKAIILDAREYNEYQVSHLKNAVFIGYNNFKIDTIQNLIPDKSKHIVVYCSVGIRSEDIAKQIEKAGYTNVFNLYGGIFEWKNNNFKVFDSDENITENIHIFSKYWGKWLLEGQKVY